VHSGREKTDGQDDSREIRQLLKDDVPHDFCMQHIKHWHNFHNPIYIAFSRLTIDMTWGETTATEAKEPSDVFKKVAGSPSCPLNC
jgi:hypothetical protein